MHPSMIYLFFICLFLGILFVFHYLFIHILARESITFNWKASLIRAAKWLVGIVVYTAVIWLLNQLTIIDMSAFDVLFNIWPLLIIGYGLRKTRANIDKNDVQFGKMLIFFGMFFSLPYLELFMSSGESSGQFVYSAASILFILFWPAMIIVIVASVSKSSDRRRE